MQTRLVGLIFATYLLFFLSACASVQSASQHSSSLDIKSPKLNKNRLVDSVVLLHGLARQSASLDKLAREFATAGYRVCNIAYPSRHFTVQRLAKDFVLPKIKQCQDNNTGKLHFVTHSMGALVVRYLQNDLQDFSLGQIVMLSPPNQGSELSDLLGNTWLSSLINGPAGIQLGTQPSDLPQNLAIPNMPFGILAATGSNSLLSLWIAGDDDGKVSLEKMRLQGMSDFMLVSSTHSLMMWNREVIEQSLHFIRHKEFYR